MLAVVVSAEALAIVRPTNAPSSRSTPSARSQAARTRGRAQPPADPAPSAPDVSDDSDVPAGEEGADDLRNAYRYHLDLARSECRGIHAKLSEVQTLAGVNTGVSALGTIAAGGALGVGIAKNNVDKHISELDELINRLSNMSDEEYLAYLAEESFNLEKELFLAEAERRDLAKESKVLGNVRTGLIIGATATSAASAAMAWANFDLSSLTSKMERCNAALGSMESAVATLAAAVGSAVDAELAGGYYILAACSRYDISKIKNIDTNQKVTAISSTVGTASGIVGATTSIIANLDSTIAASRESDEGRKKAKALNLAANVASGVTTAASGVSTGFSIATLAQIGDMVDNARRCERAFE